MGGGDPSKTEKDLHDRELSPPVSSPAEFPRVFSGARLSDAPVLLFVCFHKALRSELAELRRAAGDAAEKAARGHELAPQLLRRFEFLKLVYKYHCAAEDEVVFVELNKHVKNVVYAYALEHRSIDDLFRSTFHWLNALLEDNNAPGAFREVFLCAGALQSLICQHMFKEEEQVFPLLIQHFSFEEQASLVWQFICSVPVMLLEDSLPWMMSFLSSEEQTEVVSCLKEVVPKEESLQLVLRSWLGKDIQSTSGACVTICNEVPSDSTLNTNNEVGGHSSDQAFGLSCSRTKALSLLSKFGHHPIDGLRFWQNAISKDLNDIFSQLCQIKASGSSLHLDVTVVQLNFLADLLIFYSDALEKFFYPTIEDRTGCRSPYSKRFQTEKYIGSLQYLLFQNTQYGIAVRSYVEKLCQELESLILSISEQFTVQEREVFPIISRTCSLEKQKHLLFMSLRVLPLGLLKCGIIWFSAHMSEDDVRGIYHGIRQAFGSRSLASLLLEWLRVGYSGKTSVENFREELQKMFKRRCSILSEHIKEASGSFSLPLEAQICMGSNPRTKVHRGEGKTSSSDSPDPPDGRKYETPYSTGINLQVFFPRKLSSVLCPLPHSFGHKQNGQPFITEPIPVDLIFYIHKALRKDLDYLVSSSSQLTEDSSFLEEFGRRFRVMQFLYQIHSDAEDEIAFPALEAKGKLENVSQAYSMDHKLEVANINNVTHILSQLSELSISASIKEASSMDLGNMKYQQLCLSLQEACLSMRTLLSNHIHREEIELWPLFRECFTTGEQEKIIGRILGRLGADILQDMIPWLMESLTPEEQAATMSLWRQATRKTMFDEWLGEWWDGGELLSELVNVQDNSDTSSLKVADPLEIISTYLSGVSSEQRGLMSGKSDKLSQKDLSGAQDEPLRKSKMEEKMGSYTKAENYHEYLEFKKLHSRCDKKGSNWTVETKDQAENPGLFFRKTQVAGKYERLLTMSQEELEAAIRQVSRDPSLDPQKRSFIMQNLLMSRWIVGQQLSESEVSTASNDEVPGQHPSYRDPVKLIFGCKHYKRNCKLLAPCCNRLFTCIRCHDEMTDHTADRRSITKMMCMKCLVIQPVTLKCVSISCNNLSMGKYYCKICKLFDDERQIYHCPYCNLCRLGKGLGIDYFHCMNCNACMSRSLADHTCREKCLEENCPICHEFIFTSNSPVKGLQCGHLMHSACFQEYTRSHYTCPICSKSLGDMQVYFRMLDALLAKETIPEEYSGQMQLILCNDCEKRGRTRFHWFYHKCSYCGSYNTRLL